MPLSPGVAAAQSSTDVGETLGPADDVYVGDDGSAVLVYEEDADEGEFQLGADMASGLAHGLVEIPEPSAGQEYSGQATMWMHPDEFTFDGQASASAPPELNSLDVTASGEVSETTNTMEVDAEGSFTNPTAYPQAMAIDSAGTLTVGPNSLSSSGEVSMPAGVMGMQSLSDLSVSITEPEPGDYTATVELSQDLHSDTQIQYWNTRENASQYVQGLSTGIAQQVGGTAETSLNSHSFTEAQAGQPASVTVSFTSDFQNIDDGIEDLMVQAARESATSELTEEEARELAEYVTSVDVEQIDVEYSATDTSTDASWDIQLNGVNDASVGIVETMYDSALVEDSEAAQNMIDQLKTTAEARKAAELSSTFEWDMSYETIPQGDDGEEHVVDAELSLSNENWAAYVSEMQDRGEGVGAMSFDLEATKTGGAVEADATFEVSQDQMVETAIDSMASQIQGQPVDQDAQELVQTLQESEFEVARMDLDMSDGTVIIEAGAKFDSYEQFLPADMGYSISRIVGAPEDGTNAVYVHVDDFATGDEPVTAESLSSYDVVDEEDTTVHAPGEWDRTFPSMDAERATEYLNLDLDIQDGTISPGTGDTTTAAPTNVTTAAPTNATNETDEGGAGTTDGEAPGFTLGVALLAIVGAVLIGLRREN